MRFLLALLVLFSAMVLCAFASEPKIVARQSNGDCNLELGLECAGALAQCFPSCKAFKQNPDACFACLGGSVSTCCPCLKKAFGADFPC